MVRLWNSEAGSNVYWLAGRHNNTGLNVAKVRGSEYGMICFLVMCISLLLIV